MMIILGENLLGVHLSKLFADLSDLQGEEKNRFRILIKKMVEALNEGHSCYPLEMSDYDLVEKSPLVSMGEMTPLVFHQGNLYLHRYFHYESRLAAQIFRRAEIRNKIPNFGELLQTVFSAHTKVQDLQQTAAELALERMLAIISGGPGTGKTSTVVRILGLLLQASGDDLKIALTAPTGKAAMRLQQSVSENIDTLPLTAEIKNYIPTQAQTIHRLLGVRKYSPLFHHSSENPLPYDVLVVDEASMVDLALMSKLVDSLKPQAKLILLGDKDQLASVESGSVLADLIQTLPNNSVVLQETYRFNAAIKRLADLIKDNSPDQAWELLQDKELNNIGVVKGDSANRILWQGYVEYLKRAELAQSPDLKELFALFNSFQILCATRVGSRGADTLNLLIENRLTEGKTKVNGWYSGRPVVITRNDYSLGLYNGDIGICLQDDEDGRMKVWFETEDGQLKPFSPYRIPEYQTAYAMTIHKSQGSEFKNIIVVLPQDDNLVLSRELIYTAITRAKEQLLLVADKDILTLAMARKTHRHSGLAQMISNLQPT